jgi:DNA polymerase (family 10)
MDKEQVAAALTEMGTLLEIQGENSFRSNAYHNGALAISQYEGDLGELVRNGMLGTLRGIGETLQQKITTLVTTGSLPFLDDLRAKTPPGLLQMLRIQGLGPKKVKAMYDQLGVDTLEKLKEACEDDKVAKLKGFGAKTQQKILEGLEFLSQVGERVRIDQALPLATILLEGLRKLPGVIRIELCGSLRRRRETIKDIDLLISSDDPQPIMDHFVQLPGVAQVTGHGETKSSVVVSNGLSGAQLFHRQQGPQHRHAAARPGPRVEAQRIRLGGQGQKREVPRRGGIVQGPGLGLRSAGAA